MIKSIINSKFVYSLRVLHGKMYRNCMRRLRLRRKKVNLVVATSFAGKKYDDNPMYIVDAIHKLSPNTEIVWLVNRNCNLKLPDYIRGVDYHNFELALDELSKASVIIGNSRCFISLHNRKDQLRIETWHGGLGMKKIGDDAITINEDTSYKSKHAYDMYISNSDHLTKIFRSAFHYNGPVWKCGYPIEDALLVDKNERRIIRNRYCISQDTKIILYAPTFRSQYKWRSNLNISAVIEAFHKQFGGKWTVFVHWHPNMLLDERKLLGAIDVTDEYSIQSLVKTCDAFISDYSSSIFQAVQCNVPCFVYADDYKEYDMERGLYLPLEDQPFPYAFSNEELIDNILNYDCEDWNEKWYQYRERMGHIVTGHSADDVAKVCVEFLNGKSKSDIMKEIPFETRY